MPDFAALHRESMGEIARLRDALIVELEHEEEEIRRLCHNMPVEKVDEYLEASPRIQRMRLALSYD